MKLYRHYKGKDYTYLGEVRHSETGESLVLYNTRYECEGGRTWVRPKEMFFGDIERDGAYVKRFAPVPCQIDEHTQLTPALLAELSALTHVIFSDESATLADQTRLGQTFCLHLARIDGRAVAFKLGYALDDQIFYSWLGGTMDEFRGLNLATNLMQAQHVWAQAHGFKRVRTKTLNSWRPMLLLNLRAGFDIVATEPSARSLKIVLEKAL